MIPVFCSHGKCRSYFKTSILNSGIIATKCDSYENYSSGKCDSNQKVVFGDDLTKGAEGIYYFNISTPDELL